MFRWSQEGEYLLSGSDDYRLFIWDAYNKFAVRKVLDTGTGYSSFVFDSRPPGEYIFRQVYASHGE